MNEIELRQIRYFLTLAKVLHFGKAAIQLNITQPALSQQIAMLEKHLETKLFRRDRRQVALTPAGKVLCTKVGEAVKLFDNALVTTRNSTDTKHDHVAIGMVEYTSFPCMIKAMGAMQKLYPKIRFDRYEMYSELQVKALIANEIDIGIGLCTLNDFSRAKIESICLNRASWLVLVHNDHHLAKRKFLRLKDLDQENLIMFSKTINPLLYQGIQDSFIKAGVEMNIIYETTQPQLGVAMTSQGTGIMIGANYVLRNEVLHKNTVTIPLRGLPQPGIRVMWKKNEKSQLILDFVEFIVENASKKNSPKG